MRRTILLNKPFNVLTQFTDSQGRSTLADFVDAPGCYPAGRLDRDSEGLVVLTDDARLKHKITHPEHAMGKTYWVQVEGAPTDAQLQPLRSGVALRDGLTKPAKARLIDEPEQLWPRNPPIRKRKHIPASWLMLTLNEGRNRQVRRMCAAIGFPVLRLIRYRVGSWTIDGLASGEWREVV